MSSTFEFSKTSFEGPLIVRVAQFTDERGYFSETFEREQFAEAGAADEFVRDNQSFSHRGVIRGLHYQQDPYASAKLVRCIAGAIWDVIVDIRRDSPTFGNYEAFELSESNRLMLYIPKGFAHGFCALSDALVSYKLSGSYRRESEAGIRYDDPRLSIPWPVADPILSLKDKSLPSFEESYL